MERSIKSKQREVVEFNVIANAAGTALTGLDSKQLTMTDTGTGDKLITLPFALNNAVVQVTSGTSATEVRVGTITSTTVQILSFASADGTTATDAICHIRIIGSKVADQY